MTKAIAVYSETLETIPAVLKDMQPERPQTSSRRKTVIPTKAVIQRAATTAQITHTLADVCKLGPRLRRNGTDSGKVKDEPTPLRWSCYHRAEGSDIEAWVPAQNGLVVIAQTCPIEGVSTAANAELIVQAVNEHHKLWPLIIDLIAALEQCLTADALTWEVEQEGDAVCRKARRMLGA